MKYVLTIIALAALISIRPAHAGWPESEFGRGYHEPSRGHRYHRRPRQVRKVIVIRPERRDEGRCKPMEYATGNEGRITDPVKSAEKAWAASVSFKHGQMFADIGQAKNRAVRCAEPGPETIVDKATGIFNGDTRRRICRMEAIPCMAPAMEWQAK